MEKEKKMMPATSSGNQLDFIMFHNGGLLVELKCFDDAESFFSAYTKYLRFSS